MIRNYGDVLAAVMELLIGLGALLFAWSFSKHLVLSSRSAAPSLAETLYFYAVGMAVAAMIAFLGCGFPLDDNGAPHPNALRAALIFGVLLPPILLGIAGGLARRQTGRNRLPSR